MTDRVTVKHGCDYNHAWEAMIRSLELHRTYYDLHFPMWHSKSKLDPRKYQQISMLDSEVDEVEEELSDCFRFIGGLANVDGAVVLTPRLRVLGFGAEVIAQSRTLSDIVVAADASGKKETRSSLDGFGTRHRSAFRFCSSYEDSAAFVVSQDGGVKVVKRVGADVVMWPDINAGGIA